MRCRVICTTREDAIWTGVRVGSPGATNWLHTFYVILAVLALTEGNNLNIFDYSYMDIYKHCQK